MSSYDTPVLLVAALLVLYMSVTSGELLKHMSYGDIEDYKNHPCNRPCHNNSTRMTCDYNFLIERYHTLTKACWNCPHNLTDCARPHCVAADGGERGILVANRMLPGPGIHVCEGDTIRVRVHNMIENSEGTSLHWHGVLQKGTPYMDGVSMVTQCAIPTHTAFTYVFPADTPGTQFWHAHAGLQRGDGLFGNLVIRRSQENEPHFDLYDIDLPEYILVVNDWWDRDIVSGFTEHHHNGGSNKPESILINGKGAFRQVEDKTSGNFSLTPREVFEVEQGLRYRFRVASNGVLNCPFKISVDDHTLLVIASDGEPVEPYEVEFFNIFTGERFDFVLTANQTIGNYLLRVQGELDCGPLKKNARQTAILHYNGAPRDPNYTVPAPKLTGKGLNTINSQSTPTMASVTELRSASADLINDPCLQPKPDRQITLAMDLKVINNPRFHNKDLYSIIDFPVRQKNQQSAQINAISNVFPPSPPLSQLNDLPTDMFCNKDSLAGYNCTKELCECVHFYQIALGDVVELLLIDEGFLWNGANHPMHLHGHGFRVMAMDKLADHITPKEVEDLDTKGGIIRNFDRPPKKDTVTVPDGGYTVVRFHADNPGIWLFHCHIEYHLEIGMGVIFQVGTTAEFPPVPQGFPTCGNWSPVED